jgi:magnesium chelatase family protein
VRQPARKELLKLKSGEPSEIIRQRVIKAREKAVQRQGCNNARLEVNQLEEKMLLTESARTQMEIASERLNLSGRSMHKMLRVARTIADLDESDNLCSEHLIEALSLRQINTMPY